MILGPCVALAKKDLCSTSMSKFQLLIFQKVVLLIRYRCQFLAPFLSKSDAFSNLHLQLRVAVAETQDASKTVTHAKARCKLLGSCKLMPSSNASQWIVGFLGFLGLAAHSMYLLDSFPWMDFVFGQAQAVR